MKGKLIYTEGSSYFGGRNPYCEDWTSIVEIEGKYYRIHRWGNYTNSGNKIERIEFNPEDIPEEYERIKPDTVLRGAGTKYSLVHKNGEEIEIKLEEFDQSGKGEKIPEELKEEYRKEIENLVRTRINKEMEKNPNLNYNNIIENSDLTDEQRRVAQTVINKIEKELNQNPNLQLKDYNDIISNLVSIAKGECVIITHKGGPSCPDDSLMSPEDIRKGKLEKLADTETISQVFSLKGRRVELKDGRTYLGSYWPGIYSIDVMLDKNGEPFIKRNIHISMGNSREYRGVIDEKFPVDRFSILTGDEGSFKEYNEQVHKRNAHKKKFYKEVMEKAKTEFGLSDKQAKKLLKYAKSVTALNIARIFAQEGLSANDTRAILRKISHSGIDSVLSRAGIEYPDTKFDNIYNGARTLAHIDEETNGTRKYNPKSIREGIKPTKTMIDEVLAETVKREKNQKEGKDKGKETKDLLDN